MTTTTNPAILTRMAPHLALLILTSLLLLVTICPSSSSALSVAAPNKNVTTSQHHGAAAVPLGTLSSGKIKRSSASFNELEKESDEGNGDAVDDDDEEQEEEEDDDEDEQEEKWPVNLKQSGSVDKDGESNSETEDDDEEDDNEGDNEEQLSKATKWNNRRQGSPTGRPLKGKSGGGGGGGAKDSTKKLTSWKSDGKKMTMAMIDSKIEFSPTQMKKYARKGPETSGRTSWRNGNIDNFNFDDVESDEEEELEVDRKLGRKNPPTFDAQLKFTSDELCSDIQCQPTEYCFVPSPGIAECLPKPSYGRQPPRLPPTKHRSTLINMEQDDDKEEDEDEDDEQEKEKLKNFVVEQKNSKSSKGSKAHKISKKYEPTDDEDYEEEEDDYVNENEEKTPKRTNNRKSPSKERITEKQFPKYNSTKVTQCPSCPFGKGQIICGTDNASYSSMCRLDFHNCIHKADIRFACFGFCPCLRVYEKVFIKPKNQKNFEKTGSEHNPVKAMYYTGGGAKKVNEKTRIKLKKNGINEVLQKKDLNKFRYTIGKECSMEQLRSMGLRLLDWFQVVMNEELKHPSSNKPQKPKKPTTNSTKPYSQKSKKKSLGYVNLHDCEPQVSFMFSHFDTDRDLKLSLKELYYLEHDENEHCLEPYLTQCDVDHDLTLSAGEWCECFSLKAKPCLYHVKHLQQESQGKALLGAYVPQCNAAGHYEKVQCNKASNWCWCADKNGNEIAGTRVRGKGGPKCDKTYPLIKNRQYQPGPKKIGGLEDTNRRPVSTTVKPPKSRPKSTTPASLPPEDLEEGDDDDDSTFNLDQGSGLSSTPDLF